MTLFARSPQQALRSRRLLQTIAAISVIATILQWWLLGLSFSPSLRHEESHRDKVAFATLLLETNSTGDDSVVYFTSTRMLNYQLQYSKTTRSSRNIPFLVLVSPGVPKWKSVQLRREGATIVYVEKLSLDWMEPLHERWRDVMIKLRLFQLLEYDRILFLDADTFLLKPIDGVFDDPAARQQKTLQAANIEPDEAPLPSTYLFSTLPEVLHHIHSFPPPTTPYFNAGFFMLSPSIELFDYYISLLKLPGRFDSTYPEQDLLNYAHRENGNMPWGRLEYWWNMCLPNMDDVNAGVVSVHSKLWTEGNVLQPTEPELRESWLEAKREMEDFHGVLPSTG